MNSPDVQNDPFLRWLVENLDAVGDGTAVYENGFPVTRETEVTQYHVAFSAIVMTYEFPSQFFVLGHDSTGRPAFWYTLVSLLFGWWGFPWGPFCTIGAVFRNLVGGSRLTVGDLVDELTGHQKDVAVLTERAAVHAREQIREKGFPADAAIYICISDAFDPGYTVQYDYPDPDSSRWRGESQGLTILVDKKSERELAGLTVDCENGEFVFRKDSKLRAPT